MSGSGGRIDVAVVGVGRMGRQHARVYRAIGQANLVAVVDTDAQCAGIAADELGCCALTDLGELVDRFPDVAAVTVAVPAAGHRQAATRLLGQRIACLVEKPLAGCLADAAAIRDAARQHGAILQVGHTERFNPAVRAIAAMGITARFIAVDRVGPMTFRSLDVGVVMDMMIHDLDIALMLAASPLRRVDAVGVAVLGQHEDVANARLVFANGCVATLTSSRLAIRPQRKLRLFSEDAYVSLDYQARSGQVIRKAGHTRLLERLRRDLAAGADLSDLDYGDLVRVEALTMDQAEGEPDPLTVQLTSFLDAVAHRRPPEVDAEAGYAAVDAAERVISSLRAHRWEGLAESRV